MLATLNPQQLSAVKIVDQHLMVIAGPGTGKTKVLTTKVAYLLEQRVKPGQILALTFTKKAAAEMKDRLKQLVSKSKLPFIGTFHAFAHQLLTQHGLDQELIDEVQQLEIVKQLKLELGLKGTKVKDILKLISLKKQVQKHKFPDWFSIVFKQYQQLLNAQKLLDFDDLLIQASQLIPQLKIQYNYILVDEFQDTNQLQYQLLTALVNQSTRLMIVGDPLQAIYGFRGSSQEIFKKFKKDFTAREIVLTQNYRNPQKIIDFSHTLFPKSSLLSAQTSITSKVCLVKTFSEYTEAAYILSLIEAKIGGTDLISSARKEQQANLDRQARFSDFAVIFRTHHFARALEKKFLDSGIPFQKIGADSTLAQPEIQLIIKWLRESTNHDETIKLTELIDQAVDQLELRKIFKCFPPKLAHLKELQSLLVQFNTQKDGLKKALAYLDYLETYDYYDERADKVTLSTMHAAKGLEFKYVYLCGFEEGIIPLIKKNCPTDLAEERRLLYVVLTRASKEIFIISAQERYGQSTQESRFLADLSQAHFQKSADPQLKRLQLKKAKLAQQKNQPSLFP